MENQTILITGGAGNIGSHIVEEILNQNPKTKTILAKNTSLP